MPVNVHSQQLKVVVKIPRMHDSLRFGYRPEAIAEHQQIRHQQKACTPTQGRKRYRLFVDSGKHYIRSGDSRTRTASLGVNSSSTSSSIPLPPAVRTTSNSPSPHCTRISSVAP